jgi:hypothetical protein
MNFAKFIFLGNIFSSGLSLCCKGFLCHFRIPYSWMSTFLNIFLCPFLPPALYLVKTPQGTTTSKVTSVFNQYEFKNYPLKKSAYRIKSYLTQLQTLLNLNAMNTLKKLALATVFTLGSFLGFANNSTTTTTNALELDAAYGSPYSCGYHYQSQGTSTIESTFQAVYDGYGNYVGQARYLRQLNWHQQSETIYGAYGPYTSYFWVCTWSGWYRG